MEVGDLLEKARAARAFDVEIDGLRFVCLLPLPFDVRRAFSLARLPDGRIDDEEAVLRLVVDAMTGWDGVVEKDILPEAGTAPVAFSREAARQYLQANLPRLDRLGRELFDRLKARADHAGAETKN